MRRTATILPILTLLLALPVAASAAPSAASIEPAADLEAPAAATGELILPVATGPFGASQQAGSCSPEDFFTVFLPGFCVPGECEQACQDEDGTFLFSFFDRIYCNCFCCAN
jgi:hypothetical protein